MEMIQKWAVLVLMSHFEIYSLLGQRAGMKNNWTNGWQIIWVGVTQTGYADLMSHFEISTISTFSNIIF